MDRIGLLAIPERTGYEIPFVVLDGQNHSIGQSGGSHWGVAMMLSAWDQHRFGLPHSKLMETWDMAAIDS